LERRKLLFGRSAVLFIPGYHLGSDLVGSKLGAHTASRHLLPATRHGTGRVDELSRESDDSPSFLAVPDPLRLRQIVGDQRVEQALVERWGESGVFRLDQVEQAWDVLGRLDATEIPRWELLENHETRSTDVTLTEMLDAGLTLFDRVDDEVVERTASGRDSHVVFVVDDAEVSKTSLPFVSMQQGMYKNGRTWKPLMRPWALSLFKLASTAFSDLSAAREAFASSAFWRELETLARSWSD
jgi:hypothetical protein